MDTICLRNTAHIRMGETSHYRHIAITNEISVIKLRKIDVRIESYDSLDKELKKNNNKYILGVHYRPPNKENDIMPYNEIKFTVKDKKITK